MKNGLFFENDELIYYRDGEPKHAGVIQENGEIYYIASHGRAVKGRHVVHREMGNGILKRGTYTFGQDYKLVKGSYVAPKKVSSKRKQDKPSKFVFRLPKPSKSVVYAAILFILAILLVAVVGQVRHYSAGKYHKEQLKLTNAPVPEEYTLPEFTEDVLLCSQSAKLVYDGEMELVEAVEYGDPYRPFVFAYELEGKNGILHLSEDPALKDAKSYPLSSEATEIAIDNLKTDTDYYYAVEVDGVSYPGSFHTAASTRFVKIPGIINTRDIGGYQNQDGQTVRQGLLIRGVEMDGLVNPSYYIPEEDVPVVQDTFGFVYDLDLREPTIYSGEFTPHLGKYVGHRFHGSPMYRGIFDAVYKDRLRNIFADLAKPENYPMYLHCTWGTDRTGTIIFLLQGILNMSQEEMIREYRLTAFISPSLAQSNNMDPVIRGLEHYAGDTLQEKIVTFLTEEIGVTQEEIESIRSIFLEPAR